MHIPTPLTFDLVTSYRIRDMTNQLNFEDSRLNHFKDIDQKTVLIGIVFNERSQ